MTPSTCCSGATGARRHRMAALLATPSEGTTVSHQPLLRPSVVLMTGIMGAGKSTAAQALAEQLPKAAHVRGVLRSRSPEPSPQEDGADVMPVLVGPHADPRFQPRTWLKRGPIR